MLVVVSGQPRHDHGQHHETFRSHAGRVRATSLFPAIHSYHGPRRTKFVFKNLVKHLHAFVNETRYVEYFQLLSAASPRPDVWRDGPRSWLSTFLAATSPFHAECHVAGLVRSGEEDITNDMRCAVLSPSLRWHAGLIGQSFDGL